MLYFNWLHDKYKYNFPIHLIICEINLINLDFLNYLWYI